MKEFIAQYWLQTIFGLLISALGVWCRYINSLVKKRQKLEEEEKKRKDMEYEALKIGVISLLHDRLFQSCSYYLTLSYIPVERAEEIMDNIKMLYESYHGLGGNGTGTAIYDKFLKLKLEHREEPVPKYTNHI